MRHRTNRAQRGLLAFLVCLALFAGRSPAVKAVQPEQLAPGAGTLLYLPLVNTNAATPTLDLSVRWIEITQATQTADLSVPLVEGRASVARLYLQTNEAAPSANLQVSLSAYKDGALLPGSPLVLPAGTAYPSSTDLSQMRADLLKSINVSLPAAWLSGQVTLQASLDPANTFAEFDEANNLTSLPLTFHPVPALNVKAVPVQYTHWTGVVYPPASTAYIQAALLDVYPVSTVNLSVRSTINFSGDLGAPSEWDRLLTKVASIKKSDNAPASQVYFGVVPLLDASGTGTWFSGGVAGLGIFEERASIGLADADSLGINGKFIVQHEIGHNLGQEHAPCGVSPSDPNFPNQDGLIGEVGFKVAKFKLVLPSVFDVMGYCQPTWVSPYTYEAWFDDQVAAGDVVSLPVQDSLLLRASFDEAGMPVLHPLYSLPASPDAPPLSSDYAVEFVDAGGKMVASQKLAVLQAESQAHSLRLINTLLARPAQPFSSLRLLYRGQALLEKKFESSLAPDGAPRIATDPAGQISLNWTMALQPALVRVSSDGGRSWETLAIDQRGGELLLRPAELPTGELLFEIRLSDRVAEALYLHWSNPPR